MADNNTNNEQLSIEDTFKALDEIISVMEKRDTPLEEAFQAYEKGMKLVRDCNASLDLVEKRIEVIQQNMKREEEDE